MPDLSENYFIKTTINARATDLEIIHTYTLHNKGPSDAKRTEVKLMWPMLPLTGFNEQPPLLYGIDLPSVVRVSDPKANNDRCHIYQSVREHILTIIKEMIVRQRSSRLERTAAIGLQSERLDNGFYLI